MSQLAAVVLAGGRGERLGGAVKSELRIGGVRLLDRVRSALGSVSPVLVAHGRLDPTLLHLNGGLLPIPDLPADYGGPLAGVAAALAWCLAQPQPPEFLLSVAVDTPFLPPDFLTRLAAAIGDGAVAMAACETQDYPTNALWRVGALAALPRQVADGTAPRSLWRVAAAFRAARVVWPKAPGGDPFANLNTPSDRDALEQRATRLPVGRQ